MNFLKIALLLVLSLAFADVVQAGRAERKAAKWTARAARRGLHFEQASSVGFGTVGGVTYETYGYSVRSRPCAGGNCR